MTPRHAAEVAQYYPVAEAPQYQVAPAQYQVAPAQYQAAHDDPHTDVVDTNQTDIGEVETLQNDTPNPAHGWSSFCKNHSSKIELYCMNLSFLTRPCNLNH